MRKFALVIASLAVCSAAQAASPHEQGVAAYFGSTDLKADDGTRNVKITGRELGARAAVNISNGFFGRVEYSAFDGNKNIGNAKVNAEVDEFRIGPGYAYKISDAASVYAEANYTVVSLDAKIQNGANTTTSSSETNGFIVAIGGSFAPIPALSVYGRAGFVSVEDEDSDEKGDGPDLLAGADYSVSDVFGLFAEYRYSKLKFDDTDNEFSTYRGGVRVRF